MGLCQPAARRQDSGGNADSSSSCSGSFSDAESSSLEGRLVEVPPEIFAAPKPLSRSGGTARFFGLSYVGPPDGPHAERYGRQEDRWIGKDVAHAKDEMWFYEQISNLDPERYQLLHRWCMPYGGVLAARCASSGDCASSLEPEERQLMLLGNLRAGSRRLRLLDIKIGEETAVAGWKGKSGYRAVRGRMLDRHTNSSLEGFRLEGFDNMPVTLQSQVDGAPAACGCLGKKSRRLHLQRLPSEVFLMHWIDHSELESDPTTLLPIEYSECVLFDACRQLAQLCADAVRMPVPQMWIGSSLALACEGGRLPERKQVYKLLASKERPGLTRTNIFDWGRSELNTEESHQSRNVEFQQLREDYWKIWVRGALRILYECVVLYRRQFSSQLASRGSIVVIEVFDYDVLTSMELIGCASLPLRPTAGPQVLRLLKRSRHGEMALKSEVDVSIEKVSLSEDSRLSQAWRVTVHCVRYMPSMDTFSKTDPMVVAKVVTPGSDCIPQASTPVAWNDLSAVFNWRLEFGNVKEGVLDSLFEELSAALEDSVDMSLFPTTGLGHNHVTQRWFEAFLERVMRLSHLARGVGHQRDRRLLHWASTTSSGFGDLFG